MRGWTRSIGRLAALVALASFAGCEGLTFPTPGDVTARLKDGRIEIVNGTAKPVFTFVIGARSAMLSLWAACADPEQCPPLPPGGRKRVDWPASFDNQPETRALVYWWHSFATPNGYRPDSIRVRAVSLTPFLN